MFLFHKTIKVFGLTSLLIHLISSELINFKDQSGEIAYEYDNENENEQLGKGRTGRVFRGTRKEGDRIDEVAFKEVLSEQRANDLILESDIYQRIGEHDSIPKFYGLFPATNEIRTVMVTELLGKNLRDLSLETSNRFSSITILKIGLEVLDILEHIHSKGIIHDDLSVLNLAVGYKNHSKIYLFDFGYSEIHESMMNENGDDRRQVDLRDLARLLIRLAQGRASLDLDEEIDENVECRVALREFLEKVRHSNCKIDYGELKFILITELDKYKNYPNYDHFDWQKYDSS